MGLFKIALILLLVEFSHARPQTAEAETTLRQEVTTEASNKEWKLPRSTEKTTENVRRGDSRYTENSGNSRKSYIIYYRDTNASSSFKSRNSSSSNSSSNSSNGRISGNNTREEVSSGSVDSVRGSFDWSKLLNREGYFRRNNLTNEFPYRTAKLLNHDKRDRSIYASRRLNISKVENLGKPKNVVTGLGDPRYSRLDNFQRKALNNSGKRRLETNEMALNQNLKSEEQVDILDGKNIVAASTYRNSVKVRHHGSTPVMLSSNRFDQVGAVRHLTNTISRDRGNYFTRLTFTERIKNDQGTFSKENVNDFNESTKNSELSTNVRNIVSRYPSINFMRQDVNVDKKNKTDVSQLEDQIFPADSFLTNWPNDFPKDAEDLYNYERYTSFPEQVQNTDQLISSSSNNNSSVHHRIPAMQAGIQEIVQWMKVPAFASNKSQMLEDDEFDGPISVTFKPLYDDLEPNLPLKTSENDSFNTNNGNTLLDKLIDVSPGWQTSTTNYDLIPTASLPQKKLGYKPITQITQNTVVHILKSHSKKSNSTLTGIKDLQNNSKPITSVQGSSVSSDSRPNVELMFLSEKDKIKENVKFDENCPTIMINSFTKVNNTIQSKEGCTDLNIIINSHILNTNVIKPVETIIDDPNNVNSFAGENNKYVGSIENVYPSVQTYNYEPSPTAIYNPPSYQDDYIPQKDEIFQSEVSSEPNDVSSDVPTLQVVQNTQVSVASLNDQPNDIDGWTLSETPGETSEGSSDSVNDAVSSSENQEQLASIVSDFSGSQQANSNGGIDSLQAAGLSNRPSLPNAVSQLIDNRPSSGSALGSAISNDDNDDDDDEDEDDDDDDDGFDLSPSGVLESITSTFTYLTFFNPLNYSLFSLAAAPFAAIAAGILGIAAFIFPWTIPSAFDFGRSSDSITIRFRPNLDEVVRHSLQKYERLNEWKSKKRKKRDLFSYL